MHIGSVRCVSLGGFSSGRRPRATAASAFMSIGPPKLLTLQTAGFVGRLSWWRGRCNVCRRRCIPVAVF